MWPTTCGGFELKVSSINKIPSSSTLSARLPEALEVIINTFVFDRDKLSIAHALRWLWKINVVSLVLGEFASLGLFFVAYFPQDGRHRVVYWVHICAAMVNFSTG